MKSIVVCSVLALVIIALLSLNVSHAQQQNDILPAVHPQNNLASELRRLLSQLRRSSPQADLLPTDASLETIRQNLEQEQRQNKRWLIQPARKSAEKSVVEMADLRIVEQLERMKKNMETRHKQDSVLLKQKLKEELQVLRAAWKELLEEDAFEEEEQEEDAEELADSEWGPRCIPTGAFSWARLFGQKCVY
ncbi:hypothetical protein C9374_006518 [Naegleria lovaniensis]|uniref:Uncharacterized protein n=1 Tax=Naegleria lovaniensis TaxID=51637 RepID=A0AA88KH93_NAELO|nr:uncharacterized protein C9374_006518 [Naegleria lovaniensis]KAG2381529.1 hypothetical protein C9374_006518 [Naegleria lovaniensis]